MTPLCILAMPGNCPACEGECVVCSRHGAPLHGCDCDLEQCCVPCPKCRGLGDVPTMEAA